MKYNCITLFLLYFFISSSMHLFAKNKNEEKDQKKFEVSGFIELENYFFLTNKGNNSVIPKIEAHSKLDLFFGDNPFDRDRGFYAKAILHGYIYPPLKDLGKDYENRLSVQELYISGFYKFFDFQTGLQIIKWGTANIINPTSYFNAFDLTEILLKEEEELYIGVPAFSMNFNISDYSIKFVLVPVHTPPKLPASDGPWELKFNDVSGFDVEYREKKSGLDPGLKNLGYGGRFSGKTHYIDFSLSSYYGPDRDILLLPKFDIANAKFWVVPQYKLITSLGFDFAIPIYSVSIKFECTYTFDKSAIVDAEKQGGMPRFEKIGYFYMVGTVEWIYDENFKIIAEYLKGVYVKDNERYLDPFFSDLIGFNIEKKLFSGSFSMQLNLLFNTRDLDILIIPVLNYNFQNGLEIEISSAVFEGESDSFFGSYTHKDIISAKIKYSF